MLKQVSVQALAFKAGVPASSLEIPAYLNLVAGCVAGGVAGYLTNPFDVLKARIMLEDSPETSKINGKTKQDAKPQGMSQIKKMLKEDGMVSLFRGANVRMI